MQFPSYGSTRSPVSNLFNLNYDNAYYFGSPLESTSRDASVDQNMKDINFKLSLRTTIVENINDRRGESNGQNDGSTQVDPAYSKSDDQEGYQEDDEEEDDVGGDGRPNLCYSRHEKIPHKDFKREVRASMDVSKFINNTILLFNLHVSNLDKIVNEMLLKLLGTNDSIAYKQARHALFTRDHVHQLSNTIRSATRIEGEGYAYDQNWICAMCNIPSLTTREVAIAKLSSPTNLGQNSQECVFFILVLAPTKEKGTKNEVEVGRTFGTIFSDQTARQNLLSAKDEEEFRQVLEEEVNKLINQSAMRKSSIVVPQGELSFMPMKGIMGDLKRRLPHYVSDYVDGFCDVKSVGKTMSCSLFLYFACVLPAIAFGVLNADISDNIINVEKVLFSQVFGGLLFALIGGTPHIILLTTAPLALYTKIIKTLSEDYDLNFQAFFGMVGIFNSIFLVLYSVFGLSSLMEYSTRSSEEIFSFFISIAFIQSALMEVSKNVNDYYFCEGNTTELLTDSYHAVKNGTLIDTDCSREITLLYVILLLGTLWLGVTLFFFKKTPYLNAAKREILSDYALPIAVIVNAIIGIFLFKDIDIGKSFKIDDGGIESLFKLSDFSSLSNGAIAGAAGLGFCLSLLFFMDQNISAALVNAPQNKLKKGSSYHWDLMVIAVINAVLSLFCLPWVHAALPHSPLHVMALADVEERVNRGHISQIVVRVRETRLSSIISHILIGLSFLFLTVLANIPAAVLYGLFLYVAVTGLYGNQLFERVQLFFTEQSAYPPNHYICRVPQRIIHLFTGLQLVQLLVVCVVGFFPYPYLKMFFPILIFLLIPIRQMIIPKIVNPRYLKALDAEG